LGSTQYYHRLCIRCRSPVLHRSRTRIWERPLRLFLLRPYRCRDCGHRQYAFRHQTRSLPETQFPPEAAHTASGAVRTRMKWMLIYGLITCMLVGAIASLRFRNWFLSRPSASGMQSSLIPPAKAHDESPEHQTAAANSNLIEAPKTTTDSTRDADASVRSVQPRRSVSHEEDLRLSSSAEAIRAPRPKLPARIESTITTDNTVAVQLRIDKSGKVVDATAVSASGPVATSLVRYALATARRWRFRPARDNGKPVRSERVLEFLFRPSAS
jgi:TonB family protein